jgi:excisionase family DNA binding protein
MAQFVTVRHAAAHLGISTRTVWRRIADGTIPAYRLGGVTRIDLDELEAATKEGAA